MAGGAKEFLAREIETLRADVLKAGVLNAKALQESAESHVAHLNQALRESVALQDASFMVINHVITFARRLYGQAAIAESEQSRRDALTAIDRLAAVLDRAEWRDAEACPSEGGMEARISSHSAPPEPHSSQVIQEMQKAG